MMDINPFNSFIVSPAKNGIIVKPMPEPDKAQNSLEFYVFVEWDDFVEHLRKKTQMPDDTPEEA